MVLAADYPSFLNVLWTIVVFFAWVAWIWILIVLFTDIFRRRDIGGWAKALWVLFLLILPFLGALIYLIVNHDGMADRQAQQVRGQQEQFDSYVRQVASDSGPSAEIDRAKKLLDDGTITQAEFDALKAKALAA
jgi:Short C-terminal domain/Phospholipase_D-nuclease N-terminal